MEVIELIDSSEYQNGLQEFAETTGETRCKKKVVQTKRIHRTLNSEFQEHSQNSRTELAVKTFEIKFEERPMEKRTLLIA